MKKISVTFLLVAFQITIGQNINGNWALIVSNNSPVGMEVLVLEIANEQINTYDFDSLLFSNKVRIDTLNRLVTPAIGEKISAFKYTLKDSLTLTQHVKYQSNEIGNWKTTFWDYAKLLPTQVNYSIDSVLTKTYENIYPKSLIYPYNNIKFKEVLCNEQTQEIIGLNNCPRYRIKKIFSTYFIVYLWKKDQREWAIPIKEINKDHLLVYGVAGKKGFVKVHEIKEVKNESKVHIPDD
ncbi:hypothetical protein [Aquimarina celericrescens]|uniref:DUF3108 domain-containing protein n=1 Tax=Aquimarina celericrescens TaxID=1964542 RepID=A0ABW5AZK7_9FLAO|nr:hypothetical protein [Aquimarina celericrescens]